MKHDTGCAVPIIASVLTVVHFAAASWLSLALFGLAGGIEMHGRWTRYGGIDYAWTNLAWAPGGLLLPSGGLLAAAGAMLMLMGSAAAGWSAASLLARIASRAGLGRSGWRLWGPLILWFAWIPVPAAATMTYWHTVAY